jgi:hypothetical protein
LKHRAKALGELKLVGSGADARGEVGLQSDLCTCMAEPFVGGFRQAITQLGNVILFPWLTTPL